MKKFIIIFVSIIFLGFITAEGFMVFRHGAPPYEPDPPQFRYQYVDIYKRFFKKVRKGDAQICIPQKYVHNSMKFPAVKSIGTKRIFLVGGSVVNMFGSSDFGHKLEELNPNIDFEVINCGMGAYDSYRDYLVTKEILYYKPDLIIVLSGNNEGMYNKVKINVWAYYLNKLFRKSWVYRKSQDYCWRWLTERGLAHKGIRDKEGKIIDYEKTIRFIVREAKKKKVPIILCTLPFNFRDCVPSDTRPYDKNFLFGLILLERKDYIKAIEKFEIFLNDNPNNPFGYHFLARAYEGIKDYARAKQNYIKKWDYYGYWTNPSGNNIVKKICIEERVGLADLEAAFIKSCTYGLLGREQLYDYCHWYREYDSLVSETIIQEIIRNNNTYYKIFDFDSHKFTAPLFHSHNFPRLKERAYKVSDIEIIIFHAVYDIMVAENRVVESSISHFTTLYLINRNVLWKVKFLKNKIKKQLRESFSSQHLSSFIFEESWPCVLYHVGETFRRLRLYDKALKYFDEATFLDGGNYLPYMGRALLYYTLGNREKSLENLNHAEQISGSSEVKSYKEILGFSYF